MQKTKSNTKKIFVYQFETHFLIESATDNHEFYFSDKDYLTKSNIFFSKLDKDYVEVIYLNSQPSIVPSLYFEENMKSKYLDTNTVVSKSIVTDTSSDRKIKVVYSISDELTELLVKNNLEYSNNNYFTYLYNFLVNKISKSDGFSLYSSASSSELSAPRLVQQQQRHHQHSDTCYRTATPQNHSS